MIPYRITSLAIGLAIAFTILWLVRKDLIHTRYSVWWLIVALASALLGGFPSLVDGVASRLGVTYPPILLVIVGMGLLLIKMLDHGRGTIRSGAAAAHPHTAPGDLGRRRSTGTPRPNPAA